MGLGVKWAGGVKGELRFEEEMADPGIISSNVMQISWDYLADNF
jgi:hypothetical protein